MATINQFTTCPDCDEELMLPAIAVDQDACAGVQEIAEVSDLYIVPDDASDIIGATTWATTPTYVADSIDNAETDNTKAKHLVGIGSVGEPTSTELTYPKGVVKDSEGNYTLEFNFYNLAGGTQKNQGYTFAQKLQCGWLGFTFYYADRAGFIYGKQGGIVPSKVQVRFPKATGTAQNVAIIRISWKGYTDPDRRINPIA